MSSLLTLRWNHLNPLGGKFPLWTRRQPKSASQEAEKSPSSLTYFRLHRTQSVYHASAAQHLQHAHTHWQIENSLHWVLDIAFREDECRIRKDNGAQNFAVLRHLALNALKQEQTLKMGIKSKRLRVGWDNDYLLKVLSSLLD